MKYQVKLISLFAIAISAVVVWVPTASAKPGFVIDAAAGQDIPALAFTNDSAFWVGTFNGSFGLNKTESRTRKTSQIFVLPLSTDRKSPFTLRSLYGYVTLGATNRGALGPELVTYEFSPNGVLVGSHLPSPASCVSGAFPVSASIVALFNSVATGACSSSFKDVTIARYHPLQSVNPPAETPIVVEGLAGGASPRIEAGFSGLDSTAEVVAFTASGTKVAGKYRSVLVGTVPTGTLRVALKGSKRVEYSLGGMRDADPALRASPQAMLVDKIRGDSRASVYYKGLGSGRKQTPLTADGKPVRSAQFCKERLVAVTTSGALVSIASNGRARKSLSPANARTLKFACADLGTLSKLGDGVVAERYKGNNRLRVFGAW